MLSLAYLIAALLAIAAVIVVGLLGWWLAGLITRDKCWRVVFFIIPIFPALCIITFAVLGWLVANDPVLKTIRMEI